MPGWMDRCGGGLWCNLHVLEIAGSSILLIGGNVDLGAGSDGDILITGSVTSSDLWALGI